MTVLGPGLRYFDLLFRQQPHVIATAVLSDRSGAALIDPGPGSCLATLEAGLAAGGLSVQDLRAILLTHIHLDHAGATGALVRANPAIKVFVSSRGAQHIVDPSKLLASASRLFGEEMAYFGESLPIPAENVTTLDGGERIDICGRTLEVAYTPGHASHHVSYLDTASRIAFVGDTGGISMPKSTFVLPPTPPPDIDLAAWEASAARLIDWRPETLFLTHFGPAAAPPPIQLQNLLDRLQRLAGYAKDALALDLPEPEQAAHFVSRVRTDVRREAGEEALRYETAMSPMHEWLGLARYWRKQASAAASSPRPTSIPTPRA
jgi:glyoxylase-like metal-dependent hydrolase (beta-lactamase superfamily II)